MASKHPKREHLIPAVAYCRKSTKREGNEDSIVDQRARIKKAQPSEKGAKYKIVRYYVEDAGVC